MGRVSWTGSVLRCVGLALTVGMIGACGTSEAEGPRVDPSGSVEPTGVATAEPEESMTVTEYCAMFPSEVYDLNAEVAPEGVVVTWLDRGPRDLRREPRRGLRPRDAGRRNR